MNSFEYDDNGNLITNKMINYCKIGYSNERNNYWNRLNKLNYHKCNTYKNEKYWNLFHDIKSFIYNNHYSFSIDLIMELTNFSNKIYHKIIEKNIESVLLKSNRFLIFISFFLFNSYNGNYISLKSLSDKLDLSKNYKKILSLFLFNFREYRIKLQNKIIRKKVILNCICNYIDLNNAIIFLDKNWQYLKVYKNSVVIGIILKKFYNFKKCFGKPIYQIYDEIEVNESSAINTLKRLRNKKIFL